MGIIAGGGDPAMRFFWSKEPAPLSPPAAASLCDGYCHSVLDPIDECHGSESGLLAGWQLAASGMIAYEGEHGDREAETGEEIPIRFLP